MKPEDIKIGETYNLRIHVYCKNEDFIIARPIPPNGEYTTAGLLEILHKYAPSFTPIPSKHGTSVPTPKHDPCRLFKKGDKVRVVEWNGRKVHDPLNGAVWTVNRNEGNGGISHESILVSLFYEDDKEGHIIGVPPCYLELVTPAEELEPYQIEIGVTGKGEDYRIKKDGTIICAYSCAHPNAKAAAEAERDRLNEEHRKEQENG